MGTQGGPSNIEGVQYLRGVAALMVVAVHVGTILPNVAAATAFGVAGVDIFFVISGFIMAHSTHRYDELRPRGRQCFEFLLRRFIRVIPLYWVALLWTIKIPVLRGDISVNLVQDFFFIPRIHATGNIWPELIAGWTINYELFFYLLFGAAMLFGRARYLALTVVLSGAVASGFIFSPKSVSALFYSSPIVLEFLFGLWLYQAGQRVRVARRWAFAVLGIGIFLLLLPNGSMHRAVADGLPATAVVWAATQVGRGSHLPPLTVLGNASYSIYLFHLAVLSLLERASHSGLLLLASLPTALAFALVLALATLVGVLIHRWVETPLLAASKDLAFRFLKPEPLGARSA